MTGTASARKDLVSPIRVKFSFPTNDTSSFPKSSNLALLNRFRRDNGDMSERVDTESVEAAIAEKEKMTKTVNKMNAVMRKAPMTTYIGERRPLVPEQGARWYITL